LSNDARWSYGPVGSFQSGYQILLRSLEILEKYTGNKELILILGREEPNRFVPDRSNGVVSMEIRWTVLFLIEPSENSIILD